MKVQQDIRLNTKEQKLERVLSTLALLFILLIITGIVSQSIGVDWDIILVPSFFLSGGLFFLAFGFNGLSRGQLIEKWTPYVLYAWIKGLTGLFTKKETDGANTAWKIALGIMAILIGGVCILTAIYDLYKHI